MTCVIVNGSISLSKVTTEWTILWMMLVIFHILYKQDAPIVANIAFSITSNLKIQNACV